MIQRARSIAILALFALCCTTSSGSVLRKKPLDCRILSLVLHTDHFATHFRIGNARDTLIIIDTSGSFQADCNTRILNRPVVISDQLPDGLYYRSPEAGTFVNKIILTKIGHAGYRYTLALWQPRDNSVMEIQISAKNNRYRVTSIESGVL